MNRHLSLAEHGAYFLLLQHCNAIGRSLPPDISVAYRICRAMTPGERAAVLKVLDEFFVLKDGAYSMVEV